MQYHRVICSWTAALCLALGALKVRAQHTQKQDPDNLMKVGQASGNLHTPPWHWTNVDKDFGPLPPSVHVFRTEDSLDGRPSKAYYVSAALNDQSLDFTTQIGNGKRLTPAEYYVQEGQPLLVINASFFSFATNNNLDVIVKDGRMVAWNQPSRRLKGKDSAAGYVYTTRSALGISPDRKADVAWVFTDTTGSWPYAFEEDPVQARGQDSIPRLSDLHDPHGRRWKMETVVGGGPVLVQNGKIRVTSKEEQMFVGTENTLNPRSAIGYTRDGRLIILAVEGRNPGQADGISLAEAAKIFIDLGCYEAVNLDGGGSSCLLINSRETIRPSDKGSQRPVPSVFIIKKK